MIVNIIFNVKQLNITLAQTCSYEKTIYIYISRLSLKEKKKEGKLFKNLNSSLFQNKTSGIHQSDYHNKSVC